MQQQRNAADSTEMDTNFVVVFCVFSAGQQERGDQGRVNRGWEGEDVAMQNIIEYVIELNELNDAELQKWYGSMINVMVKNDLCSPTSKLLVLLRCK